MDFLRGKQLARYLPYRVDKQKETSIHTYNNFCFIYRLQFFSYCHIAPMVLLVQLLYWSFDPPPPCLTSSPLYWLPVLLCYLMLLQRASTPEDVLTALDAADGILLVRIEMRAQRPLWMKHSGTDITDQGLSLLLHLRQANHRWAGGTAAGRSRRHPRHFAPSFMAPVVLHQLQD